MNASGSNGTQVLEPLPDPDEEDGDAERALDGEDDAALGGRVELAEQDARQAAGLVEGLRLGQAVLPRRGIEHEEHGGLRSRQALVDRASDLGQLVHQVVLRVQPPGGVDDDHVRVAREAGVERIEDDRRWIGTRRVGHDRQLEPRSPGLELFDGSRPERVRRGQQDALTTGLVARRELGDARRLARPVDADDEDHGWLGRIRPGRGPSARGAVDEQLTELGLDGSDRRGVRAAPGGLDDVDGQSRPDVGGDERLLDRLPGRLVGPRSEDRSQPGHEPATRPQAGVDARRR